MSVDLFGGGIFGLFLHVLEVILLDVGLVEFDKSRGPLFFVQFVDNSENLATNLCMKTLLVVEFVAELAILFPVYTLRLVWQFNASVFQWWITSV